MPHRDLMIQNRCIFFQLKIQFAHLKQEKIRIVATMAVTDRDTPM